MLGLLGASAPFAAPARAQDESAQVARNMSPEEFAAAVTRLSAPEVATRRDAIEEIAQRGFRMRREATPHLRRLLRDDPDWTVRASAGRAIGRLMIREGVPDLTRALRDPQIDVRVVAAAALWRLPDPAAVPALVELLGDTDGNARLWAVLALGVAGDARATQPMLPLLDDPVEDVRLDTIRSLGRIGDPAALERLVEIVNEDRRTQPERLEAINAIVRLQGPDKVNALVRMLDLRSTELRLQVIEALAEVGDALVIPALRRVTRGRENAGVAAAARDAIRRIETRAREQQRAPTGPEAAPSQGGLFGPDPSAPG